MYGRATRNIGQTVGSTPVHVGPGTYNISKSKQLHTQQQQQQQNDQMSYAPFLSLAAREDIFTQMAESSPGPAQYNPRVSVNTSIKGGSTLANREQRFQEKLSDVPGPGTYNTTYNTSDMLNNKENNRPVHMNIQLSTSDRHSNKNIKLSRKRNPPSIQDPKYAFGFEEDNKTGELIAQAAPERDSTLGPAYYNPPTANTHDTTYKGIHFSKYSSKRTDFAGKMGPGPGDYDPTGDTYQIDIHHYNMKQTGEYTTRKAHDLNIPRYPDNLIQTCVKESVPGPGKYEQKRLFDDEHGKLLSGTNQQQQQSSLDLLGIEYERPPFGVQTKRFEKTKSLVPGPGAYNDTRIAFDSLNRIHGIKNTPFLQSSTRFDSTQFKSKSAPGPGQYKLIGFAEDNLRKAIIESRRKPAFGQSASRQFNLSKSKDDHLIPGPGQYTINKPSNQLQQQHQQQSSSYKSHPTSNFASNTKQRVDSTSLVEETPGPTAYNVHSAYENLIKLKREQPRTKNAQKRQESFNVASKRDFKFVTTNSDDIPGPGTYDAYNIDKIKHKSHSFATLNDKRFKDTHLKNTLPGPADYELSPLFQDTVLKGTFNVTLNNPFHSKDTKQTKNGLINKVTEILQVQ